MGTLICFVVTSKYVVDSSKNDRRIIIMNLFQRNLEILRRQDPGFAAKVVNSSGGTLSIQSTKSGVPTAMVKNRFLHSAYDPIREAKRWAEHQVTDCQLGDTLVVLGVGLLYH